MDIGPFFIDDCCLEAGYDDQGNLVKKDLDLKGLPSEEELKVEAAALKEDTSPEPEEPKEEETAEQKKARKQAEKEAKAAEKARKKAEKAAKAESKE